MPDGIEQRVQAGKSIFARVSLLCAVVALITILVFSLAIIPHQQQILKETIEDKAKILVAGLQHVVLPFIVEDYPAVQEGCSAVTSKGENVAYTALTRGEDGFTQIHEKNGFEWKEGLTGHWNPDTIQPQSSEVDFKGRRVIHYSYPFDHNGVPFGHIHVGIGLDVYEESSRNVVSMVVRLGIGSLVLGIGCSFIFSRRLTQPISELRTFAQRVSAGNFDELVAIKSEDEVGVLAQAMNRMTVQLKESRAQEEESIKQQTRMREQEILLKEIHHRVKNNMQILSSLMRMQSRSSGSDELKSILRDGEARIRSMGLIHEKLYQSKSLSEIDFQSYVHGLVNQLISIMPTGELQADVDIEGVFLGLDTALPCGLIINEALSNAVKYAFPDGEKGKVRVYVVGKGGGEYEMEINDNGVGLPPEDQRRKGSLGMSLIDMLVDQLDGTLAIESAPGEGTKFLITFHESEYQNRI